MNLPIIDDNQANSVCKSKDNLRLQCKFFAIYKDSYVCLKHTKYSKLIRDTERILFINQTVSNCKFPMNDNCTGIVLNKPQIPILPSVDYREEPYIDLFA